MTAQVVSAVMAEVDGIALMTRMLQRFVHARDGSEIEIAVGDIFEGPEHLGGAAVILTITGVRAVFPIPATVFFMREVGRGVAEYRAVNGSVPRAMADVAEFAGAILGAVDAYHTSEAERRARAN